MCVRRIMSIALFGVCMMVITSCTANIFIEQISGKILDRSISIKADPSLNKELCNAVQQHGYKIVEFAVSYNALPSTSGTYQHTYTGVYLTVLASIRRDWNFTTELVKGEEERQLGEAKKLCRTVQSELKKRLLNKVYVSIVQWDYVAGVRILYTPVDLRLYENYPYTGWLFPLIDCEKMWSGGAWMGAYANIEEFDAKTCPSYRVLY